MRKIMKVASAFLLLISFQSKAQQLAFPGAEGAGKYTSGGRGTSATMTSVLEVTNLNDNGTGSLRAALEASSSTYAYKTIVFRVSGTIHLNSPLAIRSNVTVAGQTASGGGICIADFPVSISGDNIIVRYIRFRLGDKNQQARLGSDDAFSGTGHKNVIIDHCTMSWSDDEAFTVYGGDSTTLQWNIISEPLNFSYHDEGTGIQNHGYGGIQGGKKMSIHHNLFAHCLSRTPRFDGVRNLSPNTPGLENVDFVNNVLYNWGANNVYAGEGGNYNLVNNYYKYGPSTNNSVKYRVVNPYKQTTTPVIPYGKFYLSGNYVDGSTTVTNNNWLGVTMEGGTQADTSLSKVTTPFVIEPLTTQSASSAYNLVLQNAGAILPLRDTLDQRIINDVRNRTGRIIDVQGGYPAGTAYTASQAAWPNLVAGTAPTDDDHDGMPNSYETANGLNPNDASDRGVVAANGYTNLENYLNSLTTAASLTVSGNVTGFSQTVGSPSSSLTYTVTGSNLTGNVTVTPPASFQVSADGLTWYSNSSPLTLSPVSGSLSTTVFVRLNASAAGTYTGNIANTSSAITQNMAVSGTAVTVPAGVNAMVAQDGSGNYTTLTAAINAAPANSPTPWVIFIKNGKYREKITIPSNKRAIQLIGESVANTILYYDDPATILGTQNSASFTVSANSFSAYNLTFANTYGDGSQAVALLINADSATLKNCRLLGNQDTYYNKGSGTPRQYLKNCYIDGNIDFIFGSAIVVFDSCVIYPKTRTTSGSSFITAPNTTAGQSYGYVFRDCKIANNTGGTQYYLSRPWGNSTGASPFANNKAVFLNTTMGNTVLPVGWTTWDAGTNTSLIYYGEYNSRDFNGVATDASQRVSWSYQLNSTQAATYTNATIFNGWDPCASASYICTPAPRDIAVSNFRATRNPSTASVDWNISWAMAGIKYELYRSATRNSGYTKIYETTSINDTAYNFNYTDVLAAPGNAFYYYLVASGNGLASQITDTVSVSLIQTLNVTGSLSAFTQNLGTPSPAQNLTVSGTNLTDDITITPPVNYEVSTNGTTWYTNSSPLVLLQSNASVPATNVSVRLNSPSLGTSSGNIVVSSTGATAITIPVTGTTAIIPPVTEVVLQAWPMTANNQDSALVRSVSVAASTPTFKNLYSSNGTTVATIPAYSPQFGQAFGATANGDGSWGTAAGGPGGTLKRIYYEQFTVTAKTNYSVRVDSLILKSAFYNTSSGTQLGVVYSFSNFVSDSANISTTPGSFTSPIALANQTAGPSNQYNLAFNGSTGLTLNPGQTLYFRLYYSCGSSSVGRYGMLKDVFVKGTFTDLTVTPPSITTNASFTPFNQTLGLPSAAQTYTVSGANLTTQLYVVAPANYELSLNGTTWNNSNTPIVLTPTSGTVPNTTIYVRLNANALGTYAGNIQEITGGAATVNVPVTGSTNATPTIITTGTLNTFSQTVGAPSANQTYSVAGLNLTGAVMITPPANYDVSADGGLTWFNNTNPLVLNPVSGGLPATTITVRLNATTAGTYNGNIVHVSAGATAVNVPVNGITAAAPTLVSAGSLNAFAQTVGAPSASQNFTLAGSGLTGNVTVTPPANYEVSDNGTNWYSNSSPLILTPVSGALNNTTISVRLNAAAPGTYSGNIVSVSAGSNTISVPVTGTTVPAPVITTTGTLTAFSNTVGTPSATQTYTIAGANLVSNVTITPPAGFEVSSNGTNWFTSTTPLVLTPTSGTLSTTAISVRMNAVSAGSFSGNITNVTSGIATVNVPVTGTAVNPPVITTSLTSLAAFTQTLGTPSAGKKYTIAGTNLIASVIVTAPAGFEVSKDSTTWSSSVTFTPTSGTLATSNVFVRMNASASGAYSGTVTHTSTGATTKNVTVSGTVPGMTVVTNLKTFLQKGVSAPSPVQSYSFTASNLLGNVIITAPEKFQLSIDSGKTWFFNPVTVVPVNNTVNMQVYVRLFSGFTGVWGGNIVHATTNGNALNVPVNGITTTSVTYMVYPVPASKMIYFTHPMRQEPAKISIYNMAGQKITEFLATPNALETAIDISAYPGGIYMAVYQIGTTNATLRFVKE